jgi:hypothetical protein
MYITKEDFVKGICRNGHTITPESHYTMSCGASRCKLCRNEDRARWVANHPEAAKAKKLKSHLKQRYGITTSREEMLAAQGSACAICGRTDCHWGKGYKDVWHIDHAHDGTINHRGILCAVCNTALGDLEPFLIRVVRYMMKWSPKFEVAIRELSA